MIGLASDLQDSEATVAIGIAVAGTIPHPAGIRPFSQRFRAADEVFFNPCV